MSLPEIPEASFVSFHVSASVSVLTFKEKEFRFQSIQAFIRTF